MEGVSANPRDVSMLTLRKRDQNGTNPPSKESTKLDEQSTRQLHSFGSRARELKRSAKKMHEQDAQRRLQARACSALLSRTSTPAKLVVRV